MMNVQSDQPPSLRIFFATEMWERYGFYVVQTLLALFLSLHFKWNDKDVYALVGSFTALTYISPVIGGWIADYLIGQKRAIFSGALILFVSYIALMLLAFNDDSGTSTIKIDAIFGLTASLAGIAVGTGLLKPNISSLLGNEYPEGSAQREAGFTIFYMGITSGIILGSTVPGVLNYHFGWPTSFMSAAFGMIIAIVIFAFGCHRYKIADYSIYEYNLRNIVLAGATMICLGVAAFFILHYPVLANSVFIGISILSLLYFIYSAKQESCALQAKKIWVIGLLCVISVLFWALYFQMFLSLTLFIARVVQPTLLGIQFPAPYYVSIQSLGAIVFGSLILFFRKKYPTSTRGGIDSGNKFVISMCFMSLGYLIISAVCHLSIKTDMVSPLYIIPAYLMISLAELYLYPVGLSAITVLANRKKVSTMMGIFLVSLGMGGFLSGKLAFLTAISSEEASISILKTHYAMAFNQLFYILLGATALCVVINCLIRYLLKEEVKLP